MVNLTQNPRAPPRQIVFAARRLCLMEPGPARPLETEALGQLTQAGLTREAQRSQRDQRSQHGKTRTPGSGSYQNRNTSRAFLLLDQHPELIDNRLQLDC